MVRDENLDFWVEHGYNVLFMGHAGVGKTSIIKAAFERHNLNWRYFSASTMDPWVDLVGVPKERIDEATGEAYLDLIRPKGLDEVEAIFFDEFNRSHKKVRNACMELLQFKTINGRPFPNLKIVWSAINPDGDEGYDVEKLDPAQEDRFHIYVDIPYKPDQSFFASKYGDMTARAAISWWNGLPLDIQKKVSPRRLDYALDVLSKQGDVNFVLPEKSNVGKLLATLKHGPIEERLEALYKRKDPEEARKFLASENTYQAAIPYIKKSVPKSRFFLPLVSGERLSVLASEMPMLRFMITNSDSCESFSKVVRDIYDAKQNGAAVTEINKYIRTDKAVAETLGYDSKGAYRQWPMGASPQGPYLGAKEDDGYAGQLDVYSMYMKAKLNASTAERRKIYDYIETYIPKKMSSDDALATLRLLDLIVKRSQYTTVQKLDNLVGLFNQCANQIHRNQGLNLTDIVKRYSTNHFRDLWKTIRENKDMSAKVIPYGNTEAA